MSIGKETASMIQAVHYPDINKLLYLHNQMGKRRAKQMQNGGLYHQNKQLRITPRLQRLFYNDGETFYHHYWDQSLQVQLHSALLSALCDLKSVLARMHSGIFFRPPCTLQLLMKAPQHKHMRSLKIHMCWSNLLVQDNDGLYDYIYWSIGIFFSTILVHIFYTRVLRMLIKIIINRRSLSL